MTILKAIQFGIELLNKQTRETESDIRYLLSSLIKEDLNKAILLDYELSEIEFEKYQDFLKRLLKQEPVQYIVGKTEFYSLPIIVKPGVLIPRQDTELLIDKFQDKFQDKAENIKVLDLCAGTGCIGIALMSLFKNVHVTFLDKYDIPIKCIKENLKLNNFEDRSEIIKIDLFSELFTKWSGSLKDTFDAILTNPPYIPLQEYSVLDKKIINYEPKEALLVADDGLLFYRKIAQSCKVLLKEGSSIFLEIPFNHFLEIKNIFLENYLKIEVNKDLTGKNRCLVVKY